MDARTKIAITQQLLAIADRTRGLIASALAESDVPPSAADALRILATSAEPITPREMARRLARDPSTASLTADKLEQAGLIERRPHPTDGRMRQLVLTERGAATWNRMRDSLHRSAMFERLTADERVTLLGLLARMG